MENEISFEIIGDNDLEDGTIFSTVSIEWAGAVYTTVMHKNIKSGKVSLGHVVESLSMFEFTLLTKRVQKEQKQLKKLIRI